MVLTQETRMQLLEIVREATDPILKAVTNTTSPPPPVLETRTDKPTSTAVSTESIVDAARGLRAAYKKEERVLEQFRNHPQDSANANRAIRNAKEEVREAELAFVEMCRKIACGELLIER